jgi:aminoglycoside phosphotransferase (APT) family kinase protein
MRQGAVGHVHLVRHEGRTAVRKRLPDPGRHRTELVALGALAGHGLPVPEVLDVGADSITMTRMPGTRLDEVGADDRLHGLRASGSLLRRLHRVPPPAGLPEAPDDAGIIRRYRAAGGPPLPLTVPRRGDAVFCHGDWTDGNLLAQDGGIAGIVDWEAAHVGDPLRELARAAWGASRKDRRSFDVLVEAYGADPVRVREWVPIHAAELWLWFAEAGPPEYLQQLTVELVDRPRGDV